MDNEKSSKQIVVSKSKALNVKQSLNKKSEDEDFANAFGNIVSNTVGFAAGLAWLGGKALYAGGKLAAKGISKAHETYTKDRVLLKEIDSINDFCNKISKEFESHETQYQYLFDKEREAYIKNIESAEEQFEMLEILQKFYFSRDDLQKLSIEVKDTINLARDVNSGDITTDTLAPLTSGLGAGLGVGVGAVGLMTAFGTAGTGSALSSLSGAAYFHATLAALGGGTLASGGLGMAGGAVVLGVAFLGPAIAVAAFAADSQIKAAHKKALERKNKAVILQEEGRILFNKLDNGVKNFREINYDFYNACEFFQELINVSLAAPIIHFETDYYNLLREMATVIQFYGNLGRVGKLYP